MNLTTLIQQLSDHSASSHVQDHFDFVVLERVAANPVDSDDGWRSVPVVAVDVDGGDEVQLVPGAKSDGLEVGVLRTRMGELRNSHADSPVVVRTVRAIDPTQRVVLHTPVIATMYDRDERFLGVIPWYEGCYDELG